MLWLSYSSAGQEEDLWIATQVYLAMERIPHRPWNYFSLYEDELYSSSQYSVPGSLHWWIRADRQGEPVMVWN